MNDATVSSTTTPTTVYAHGKYPENNIATYTELYSVLFQLPKSAVSQLPSM